MGNPLQEQLLKAGLATKKQAKKAEHEKRVARQQSKESGPVVVGSKVREEQAALELRNRELNRLHLEEARARELKAQVKQLVEANRLAKDDRGEPYHFAEGRTIKRIFVSSEITDQLSRGQLAIVKLGNSYEVVPAKVAQQIASRDQEAVLVWHTRP